MRDLKTAKRKADPALISEGGNIPRDIGKTTVIPRVPGPNVINEVAKGLFRGELVTSGNKTSVPLVKRTSKGGDQ